MQIDDDVERINIVLNHISDTVGEYTCFSRSCASNDIPASQSPCTIRIFRLRPAATCRGFSVIDIPSTAVRDSPTPDSTNPPLSWRKEGDSGRIRHGGLIDVSVHSGPATRRSQSIPRGRGLYEPTPPSQSPKKRTSGQPAKNELRFRSIGNWGIIASGFTDSVIALRPGSR